MPVVECDVEAAREALEAAGAEISGGNTDHERWRAHHGDAVAVAYDDKVVVQGSDTEPVESVLRREVLEGPDSDRAHVYFDGASRGNPGPAAIGWAIVTSEGIVDEDGRRIGKTTNNRAEYEALLTALRAARDLGFDRVDVRGDSQLIVKQVRGKWNTNDPELRERRVTARELLTEFEEWSLEHVPREANERADRMANEAFED